MVLFCPVGCIEVLIRECNTLVDVLQGQFALDGRKRQNLVMFFKIGKNPLSFLTAVMFKKNLVLGDEEVFLQRWELSVVREFFAIGRLG